MNAIYSQCFLWERQFSNVRNNKTTRGGCWFCHNQNLNQLKFLRKQYPKLWNLLLKWDSDSPIKFRLDFNVRELEERFAQEDLQCELF